jgi:hypothetical protein
VEVLFFVIFHPFIHSIPGTQTMSLLHSLRDSLWGKKKGLVAPREPLAAPARAHDLPPFTLEVIEAMRFDPQIRIGLGARNGLLMSAQATAISGDERVQRFVQSQWNFLWRTAAHVLMRAELYGFLPVELSFREERWGEFAGLYVLNRVRDYSPRRTRLLLREGEIAGFRLDAETKQERDVLAPWGLVCTYDAEFGNPYGTPLLERAYAPWFEKWMHGGAKKLLRLRMLKDAYIGDIFWYPPDRQLQLASGETVSWRDVAREMIEARQSGGAMTLPLLYDKDGRKLVDYTPPRDLGGASGILTWKHDLDLEIWKALEVPPEVIEAARVGSGWSGRSVPLVIALAAVQSEFAELVRCVDRDLLRGLVEINFGVNYHYELHPQPLLDANTLPLASKTSANE